MELSSWETTLLGIVYVDAKSIRERKAQPELSRIQGPDYQAGRVDWYGSEGPTILQLFVR
jgi:hypothetical protein